MVNLKQRTTSNLVQPLNDSIGTSFAISPLSGALLLFTCVRWERFCLTSLSFLNEFACQENMYLRWSHSKGRPKALCLECVAEVPTLSAILLSINLQNLSKFIGFGVKLLSQSSDQARDGDRATRIVSIGVLVPPRRIHFSPIAVIPSPASNSRQSLTPISCRRPRSRIARRDMSRQ